MNSNDCKYIPIREAVKITGMCAQTLRKLCDDNKIEFYKTESGQRKFNKNSLEKLCNSVIKQINISSNNNINPINNKYLYDIIEVDDSTSSSSHVLEHKFTDMVTKKNPSVNKKKLNIFYLNNTTENLDTKISLINKKKMFDNYIIIAEENGINKLLDYCFDTYYKINVILIDEYYKKNITYEYDILKYIVEKTKNNTIEISLYD